MLTREDIDNTPWFGNQRNEVLELIDHIDELERERDEIRYTERIGVLGSEEVVRGKELLATVASALLKFAETLPPNQRCEFAVRLCEGTSMKVAVR